MRIRCVYHHDILSGRQGVEVVKAVCVGGCGAVGRICAGIVIAIPINIIVEGNGDGADPGLLPVLDPVCIVVLPDEIADGAAGRKAEIGGGIGLGSC